MAILGLSHTATSSSLCLRQKKARESCSGNGGTRQRGPRVDGCSTSYHGTHNRILGFRHSTKDFGLTSIPMTFHQHTLANDLQLIGETTPSAKSVAVGFFVRTGARDETPDVCGVTHFLEHMV